MSLPLRRVALFAAPVFSLFLASCGDEAKCQGADLNGVCFVVSNVVPRYNSANTNNVDVVQGTCGTTPEPFFDHSATLTLSAFTIGNNRTNSTRILLTRYTISYRLNPGSDNPALGPAIPSSQANDFGANQTLEVAVNGTQDADLNLFDINQKQDFAAAMTAGAYPSYTATYTVYGADEYGREVSSTGSTEIKIGDYNNCS